MTSMSFRNYICESVFEYLTNSQASPGWNSQRTKVQSRDCCFFDEKQVILSAMGPYGLKRAHIKKGESHIAQDHFWIPEPKKALL